MTHHNTLHGPKPPSSELFLIILNSPDGLAHYGGEITFKANTTAETPFVHVLIRQDGVIVAEGWRGLFKGAIDYEKPIGLSSPVWQSGAASGHAMLVTGVGSKKIQTLATLDFQIFA